MVLKAYSLTILVGVLLVSLQLEHSFGQTAPIENYTEPLTPPEDALSQLEIIIKERRQPWEVYLQDQTVTLDITVHNPGRLRYLITLDAELVGPTPSTTFQSSGSEAFGFEFPIAARGSHTETWITAPLNPGGYLVRATAYHVYDEVPYPDGGTAKSYDAYGEGQFSFVVYTEDSRNNLLIAIGTILGSLATAGTLFYQIRTNRQNIRELRIQNKHIATQISNEKQRLWNEAYHNHSLNMGSAIFSGWTKSSTVLASCEYRHDGIKYTEPRNPTNQEVAYSEEAKQHFEKGYPDEWKTYEEARDESLLLSNEIRRVLEEFEKKITDRIKDSSTHLQPVQTIGSRDFRCIVMRDVFWSIFDQVNSRIEKQSEEYAEIRAGSTQTRITDSHKELCYTDLVLRTTVLARDESGNLASTKDDINGLLGDTEIHRLVEEYHSNRSKLIKSTLADKLHISVHKIHSDIIAGLDVKGEGVCHICKHIRKSVF